MLTWRDFLGRPAMKSSTMSTTSTSGSVATRSAINDWDVLCGATKAWLLVTRLHKSSVAEENFMVVVRFNISTNTEGGKFVLPVEYLQEEEQSSRHWISSTCRVLFGVESCGGIMSTLEYILWLHRSISQRRKILDSKNPVISRTSTARSSPKTRSAVIVALQRPRQVVTRVSDEWRETVCVGRIQYSSAKTSKPRWRRQTPPKETKHVNKQELLCIHASTTVTLLILSSLRVIVSLSLSSTKLQLHSYNIITLQTCLLFGSYGPPLVY